MFPINHGIIYQLGYGVMPHFVAFRYDTSALEPIAEGLRASCRAGTMVKPIPYRRQNGGDYTMPDRQLRPEPTQSGTTGFTSHLNHTNEAA
ncbi:hypothetical protein [Halothiobacillus diazotrophicus]|uniref:hypothetical protein n=1 Tax=Halothiobacillus diazotrophicus TaxID=1860122 RepID=UPI0012E91CD5|nr:hypothetical protein [Halothiobacillus diazotrophicus]